jgi:hypothetical protein
MLIASLQQLIAALQRLVLTLEDPLQPCNGSFQACNEPFFPCNDPMQDAMSRCKLVLAPTTLQQAITREEWAIASLQ